MSEKEEDILDREDVPWLSFEGDFIKCKVVDVYDCDTVTLVLPFNGKPYKKKCRLYGIDSAEIRTKNLEEKKFAIESRDWLRNEINGKKLWAKCGDFDKYGRLIVTLYETNDENTNSINKTIIDKGMAYGYDGGKKLNFEDWHKE